MDNLIDFAKYTTALAVGLLLYIPANFLPHPNQFVFWTLFVTVLGLGASALFGILLYLRATTILTKSQEPNGDDWLKLWGCLHLCTLFLGFGIGAGFFIYCKVWAPSPAQSCTMTVSESGTTKSVLTFPCQGLKVKP